MFKLFCVHLFRINLNKRVVFSKLKSVNAYPSIYWLPVC